MPLSFEISKNKSALHGKLNNSVLRVEQHTYQQERWWLFSLQFGGETVACTAQVRAISVLFDTNLEPFCHTSYSRILDPTPFSLYISEWKQHWKMMSNAHKLAIISKIKEQRIPQWKIRSHHVGFFSCERPILLWESNQTQHLMSTHWNKNLSLATCHSHILSLFVGIKPWHVTITNCWKLQNYRSGSRIDLAQVLHGDPGYCWPTGGSSVEEMFLFLYLGCCSPKSIPWICHWQNKLCSFKIHHASNVIDQRLKVRRLGVCTLSCFATLKYH